MIGATLRTPPPLDPRAQENRDRLGAPSFDPNLHERQDASVPKRQVRCSTLTGESKRGHFLRNQKEGAPVKPVSYRLPDIKQVRPLSKSDQKCFDQDAGVTGPPSSWTYV